MTRFTTTDKTRVINKAADYDLEITVNSIPAYVSIDRYNDKRGIELRFLSGTWSEVEAFLDGVGRALDGRITAAPVYGLNHENCTEGNERWARQDETVFVTESTTYAGAKAELLGYVSHMSDDVPEDWDVRAATRAVENAFSTVGKLNRRIAKSKADTARIVWFFKQV